MKANKVLRNNFTIRISTFFISQVIESEADLYPDSRKYFVEDLWIGEQHHQKNLTEETAKAFWKWNSKTYSTVFSYWNISFFQLLSPKPKVIYLFRQTRMNYLRWLWVNFILHPLLLFLSHLYDIRVFPWQLLSEGRAK